MRTKAISFLLALAIIFSSLLVFSMGLVYAQSRSEGPLSNATKAAITDDEVKTAEEARMVNSFELFWPLVAGKTESDSFYFLKLLKERIQGWFIGNDSKKADYEVLLGTKRMLETEALIKSNKIDSALKALERADSHFSKAYNYIKAADSKKKLSIKDIRRERLINLKALTDYLKTTAPEETRPGLNAVREGVNRILGDYLP